MGRIVVTEFVALDGAMEDPGGSEGSRHGGWSFEFSRGDEGDRFKLEETLSSEALLLGSWTATSSSTGALGSSRRCSTTTSSTSSG